MCDLFFSAFALQKAEHFNEPYNNNNNNTSTDSDATQESCSSCEQEHADAAYMPNRLKLMKEERSAATASKQVSYSNANLNAIPLTPRRLLGNFEESLLNGRMNPVGIVDGFYAEIGASGSFFPEHVTLPVNTAFYQVCEDVAASPYLGVLNLGSLGKRGYKVPNKGTIQVVRTYLLSENT
jgi:hypothetical protein